MFVPPELWEVRYRQRTSKVPQPPEAQLETLDVIQGYVKRIEAGFQELRRYLSDYRPDVLIVVGDDQGEVFHPTFGMPTFAIFSGERISGSLGLDFLGQKAPEQLVSFHGLPGLAEFLAQGLMERGFDLTCVRELRPLGKPDKGIGHAFTRPPSKILPSLEIPVIPVFVNCYYPPLPSARRCYELGAAIRSLLEERPERAAILGSGGLSHDIGGPRSGWIDQPLDRFVLQALSEGKPEKLFGLFTFDSDTLRSGTGEIRNWIAVAGAFPDRKVTLLDYIPAHHAITGLGFAVWPEPQADPLRGG
jgi:protocatechuate 4,5-dioxygenase beta chain